MKKILAMIFLVNLLVMGGVYLFLNRLMPEPVWVQLPGLGIRSLFPSDDYRSYTSQGWEGFQFRGDLRVLARHYPDPHAHLDPLLENAYDRYQLKKDIPLFDRGVYVLRKKSKGYILAAIFIHKERIYWLDMVSNSTLDFKLHLFHQLLTHLEIDGETVSSSLEAALPVPGAEISFFTIQPSVIFLLMFTLILFVSLGLVYLIFHLATRPPPPQTDGILRLCTRDVMVTYRKGWQRSNSPACLCREGDRLVIYRFRKPIQTIDLSREGHLLKRRKKTLTYGNFSVRVSDADLRRLNLYHLTNTRDV